ncbi:MAG: hypothetical protein EG822_14155 [Deltaproteobacteria bacterium]|nr:hypothetical protein [Deltaproteobacteria bacterium]TLN03590.1 MAG: O-antigen ligase family protein [bacterium]
MIKIGCEKRNMLPDQPKQISLVLVMVCIYIFLCIERPWESIRYLEGLPLERVYAISMIITAFMCDRFKIVSSPTNKWVYGLLLLHFVLAPFAFNSGYAVDQGFEYAKMIVLYLLMLSVADDEESLNIMVKVFVFSMIIYSLHSIWEYHNGRHEWRMGISRMVGVDRTFSDPNAFGASVVLSLPFVYALLRSEAKSWLRNTYYGYFALAVICVVLTGSRTSFVALIAVILIWILVQKGKRRLIVLVSAILAVGVIWAAMPVEKQNRIRTLWDENAGPENATSSAEGRMIGWKVSWKMFKQVPLTGVGAGGANFIGYRMANNIDEVGQESPTQPHVLYGQVLAEFGVGGALMLVGLVVAILRCCLFSRTSLQALGSTDSFVYSLSGAVIAGLVLLLLFGFGGHNFYRPLWLWLAAWAGGLYKITNLRGVQSSAKEM